MKHIFRINNYTVFIISLAIIRKYKIKENDCIFFIERNLKIPIESNIRTISFDLKSENLFNLPPIQIIKEKVSFDQFVENAICGDYFYFYGFNFSRHVVQLFITNKRCKKVFQLEEGLSCYQEKNFQLTSFSKDLSIKRSIFNFLLLKNRLKNYGISIEIADGYFVLSNQAYPGFKPKINVLNEVKDSLNTKEIRNSILIIFDASSSIGIVNLKNNLESFKDVLHKIKRTSKKIFLKFHPIQPQSEREQFIAISNKLIHFQLLDDDFIIEKVIFSNSTNLYLGLLSSLLVYAKISGNASFSYFFNSTIIQETSKIKMPEIFFETIQNVDNNSIESYLL